MSAPIPESQDRGRREVSPEHWAGLEVRRADQDQTLDAIHRLEAALVSAAPRREPRWRDNVAAALGALDAATRAYRRLARAHHPDANPDAAIRTDSTRPAATPTTHRSPRR